MAEISGLSVRVSAATSAFTTGMNRVQDTASEAAMSLRRLSFASERAESNLDEVGRSAVGASGGIVTFGATTEGAGFAVRGLSGSILLSLLPALATLSAALAPVVAGLGGLVAIAGAIGGIGIVGLLGAIATNGEEMKVVFSEVVDTLKTELAPAFDLAASAIMFLMGEFMDVIPELLPARDVLTELAGNFVQLGKEIINMLPALVELATTLALEFLPPFVTFVQEHLPQVPGLIMSMVSAFRGILPIFMDFGRFLGRFLPELMDFGMVALPVVADGLGMLGGVTLQALSAITALDAGTQSLLAQLSFIAPILLALASVLGGPVTLAIAGVAAAFATNFGGIRDIVDRTVSTIQRLLGGRGEEAIAGFIAAWEAVKPVLEPIANFFATTLALGVINVVDAVLTLGEVLGQLADGEFKAAFNTIVGFFERFFTRLVELINKFTGGALESLVNKTITALNKVGGAVEDFASFAGLGDEFNFEEIGKIDIGTTPFQTGTGQGQPVPQTQQTGRGEEGLTNQQNVVVTVEGDTGVIKDVAAETVQQNERNAARRNRRNSGTATRGG